MIKLPEAILFDLDDTILSLGGREAMLLMAVEEHLAEPGLDPTEVAGILETASLDFWSDPKNYPKWRNDLLTARIMIAERAFLQHAGKAPALTPALAKRVATTFHEIREGVKGRLFPGALETVQELGRRGVKLALITNGHADTQREKVERFGLAQLFDHVQIEGEVGFGKPEERAYRHAMGALNVRPENTWMVGDHLLWEVEAPQRLGIFAIWHDHLGKGLPAGTHIVPDRIILRIPELLEPFDPK
jgi:putative hydrolase of the HAD superfamily